MKKTLLSIGFIVCWNVLVCQDNEKELAINGLFVSNLNFAIKDEKIGASATPFYEDKKWGGDAWLDINAYYRNWQFSTRLDGYHHSILLNPEDVYTKYGIGYFNVRYSGDNFNIEGGHFYGQIGNGLIMRSYRDLNLLIDNSILGVKGEVYLPRNQKLMLFGGKPKDLFHLEPLWNAGGEYRNDWKIGSVYLSTGAGGSFKFLDQSMINDLVDEVQYYFPEDRVELYRSSQAITFFNDLSAGVFNWALEYSMKFHDPFYNSESLRTLGSGENVLGRFETKTGKAFYTQFGLDFEKISFQLEGKYIDRFINKSDPFSFNYRNDLNFIPPMARVQTYRLKARYIPATQFLGEKSLQMGITYPLKKHLFQWSNTLIYKLDNSRLYEEYDLQWEHRDESSKWVGGLMYQDYNQSIYEGKGGNLRIQSWIPYVEFYKRIKGDQSLKIESQSLLTEQDKGNLFFVGMEYALSSQWTFNLSCMYEQKASLFYPSGGFFYRGGNGLYGLNFVKQLEGYVCSGGICRYEPAFSGVKVSVQTRF
ncbi:DUF6029 family protein [Membranihabitans maritimus]|uniref:DUF6029 family protein n=1 Tax=Membranihabitans maritimus TaxID=2904244 RepID=UPI001F214E79|nr:DUF6029 family protein [Membranihabitans maritimus]